MENHSHNHTHEHSHEHTHEHSHDHSHEHSHDHEHQHTHHSHAAELKSNADTNQVISLLKYMLQHNEHHTQELLSLAQKMESSGLQESASLIKQSVICYEEGNAKLSDALSKSGQ